jgi:hypothetical protein
MKTRRILICLIVFTALITTSGSIYSEARSHSILSGALSGGSYVLTLQPAQATNPSGYQLLDEMTAAELASGCCCKACLPILMK